MAVVGLLTLACSGPGGKGGEPAVKGEELREHVVWLASDALGGRRAGTREADRAARYLANEFRQYRLTGMGDDGGYLQAFDFVSGVVLGRENSLSIVDTAEKSIVNDDWRPLAFSEDGSGAFEVVFAGYGISAADEGYDDYANFDVEGKAVLVLPYGPQIEGGGMRFPSHHALRRKAVTARDRGAAVILIGPHPSLDPPDFLEPLRFDTSPSSSGIMAVTVTLETAEALLGEGVTLYDLHRGIDEVLQPLSRNLGVRIQLSVDVEMVESTGFNVLGAVTGAGPDAPWLIIGAHYDHLGMGGDGSLTPEVEEVHNGADDNASGTAGVLELAQAFAAHPPANRNVLFAAFSAEELGLLGSSHMAANLPEEMGTPEAMVNMDMVGRLTDNSLTIYGTGTSPAWDELLDSINRAEHYGFRLSKIPDGYGSSDHSSFYSRNIPVLAFFTGTHRDYHRPSDDSEKLNYAGEERIVRFIGDLMSELDRRSETIAFQQVAQSQEARGDRQTFNAYTGVIPDFSYVGEGFGINGVNDGSPAATAGLEPGDVILRMGERTIRNIFDYMYALEDGVPGQRVEMEIRRGDRIFKVLIVLGNRRTRGSSGG